MAATTRLALQVETTSACAALGVPRTSFYRQLTPFCGPRPAPAKPTRALSDAEREAVLAQLNSERFQNQSPIQVSATLLDEGRYLCSVRTMNCVLEEASQSYERRDQLIYPAYQKRELLASAPNELWSWDITKLLGSAKRTYFHQYLILDVFSRYLVGWMLAFPESAHLAKQLIAQPRQK